MHTIHYSTIARHTFSPSFFSIKGQQLVFPRNESDWFDNFVVLDIASRPEQADWQNIFNNYDYVWLYQNNDTYIRYLESGAFLSLNLTVEQFFALISSRQVPMLPLQLGWLVITKPT